VLRGAVLAVRGRRRDRVEIHHQVLAGLLFSAFILYACFIYRVIRPMDQLFLT
jgi:hypothetical protein